jgi:hypothetical protein
MPCHPSTRRTQRIRLDARLTFQYVQGWAYEDQWVSLASAKVTGATLVGITERGAFDETRLVRHLVTLDAANWAQAKAVYRRHQPGPTFTRWLANMASQHFACGCRCEHDCCGHWQTRVSARYIGKRRLSLELHNFRNL